MTYYCTKCKRNHVRGKIYDEHMEYRETRKDRESSLEESSKVLVNEPKKHPETDWESLPKSKRMFRYNSDGNYVERYMTKMEEIQYAKTIALAQGKGWNRIKEWKRCRKRDKLRDKINRRNAHDSKEN